MFVCLMLYRDVSGAIKSACREWDEFTTHMVSYILITQQTMAVGRCVKLGRLCYENLVRSPSSSFGYVCSPKDIELFRWNTGRKKPSLSR